MLTALNEHQRKAVEAAIRFDGFALFPEPRARKTLIALALAEHWQPRHVIVICPTNAIRVWHSQHKEHLGHWPWHLEVMTYESFVNRRKDWYKWGQAKGDDTLLIVDESHYIKRRGSKRSMSVRHFAHYIKYRLVLTGTPIAQGIQDAWAQMDVVDPELFGDWDSFERRYLVYGGFKKKQIVGYNDLDHFNSLFHSRSFRVTLREVRPTPLIIKRIKCRFTLGPAARAAYDELQAELETEVNRVRVRVANVLALCMKQQQITGGWLLSETGPLRLDVGGKLAELDKVVGGPLRGKRFIVICRFIHEIDELSAWLQFLGKTVKIVKGGQPFNGQFDTDCVLLQVQSGIAVDMALAHATVFYSTDYSYLNYEQARFRILDYNKRQATFYHLIAENTIDEDIYQALIGKKKLADLVCDKYRRQRRISAMVTGTLEKDLEQVKSDLSEPPPEPSPDKEVKKMAKSKKSPKKVAAKSAKTNGNGHATDEGKVTLAQLASEAGITTAGARRKLRGAELERSGRWSWAEGSRELQRARKALGLEA